MWNMSVPWWEFVVRGIVVYVFLLIFLRATGKRQTGQYAPFDLVLLLILSNAVQNSMNAGDNSLIGGLISASTLIFCHVGLAHLTYRFRRLERLIDGHARASGLVAEVAHKPARPFDVSVNVLDCGRLEAETGWKAQIMLPDGVGRAWHWQARTHP